MGNKSTDVRTARWAVATPVKGTEADNDDGHVRFAKRKERRTQGCVLRNKPKGLST